MQPSSSASNHLTLAVAGSRKTQELVEYAASLPTERRVLILTYTQTNQLELRSRLSGEAGAHHATLVMGWFSFLLRDFARPFVPFKFPGRRVLGFNFEGRPHRLAKGVRRFFDSNGYVYRCELARLAHELVEMSGGALLRRLECIYDDILIDEIQDLSGYDWGLLDILLASTLRVRMVGDIRQAVLSTNPRSAKNKQYAYASALRWFREREARGKLRITEKTSTWRCRPEIARFSDSIFSPSWSFPNTTSLNTHVTGHDGVFLVLPAHVEEYVSRFQPACLRERVNSGRAFSLDYVNFGLAKGMTYRRILIVPTAKIERFVQTGMYLDPVPASKFYVAVTRAAQSVAIVLKDPGDSTLPYWNPAVQF